MSILDTGINTLKAQLGQFAAGQAREICRLATSAAAENKAVFQRRKECAELVEALEKDLVQARERLSMVENTLERARTSGEGLVQSADNLCEMLIRQLDVIIPAGEGTATEIYDRITTAVEWLRRAPMPVIETPAIVLASAQGREAQAAAPVVAAALAALAALVTEEAAPVVAAAAELPAREAKTVLVAYAPSRPNVTPPSKRTHVPYTPPSAPKKPVENEGAWLLRQVNMLRTRQAVDHPQGWGAAQLIAVWAVRDVTNAGRSKNHKFVPVKQAAETIADRLRTLNYPYSEWTMTDTWAKKIDSSLERAQAKGLPVVLERFSSTARPDHLKKYNAFSAYRYVTEIDARLPKGTFPEK